MADSTKHGAVAGAHPAPDSGSSVVATIAAQEPASTAAPPLPPCPFPLAPHLGQPALRLWLRSRTGLASLGLAGLAGFLLVVDHWIHLVGALPYLMLAACPLLHLFMHGGHGGHHGGGQASDPAKPER